MRRILRSMAVAALGLAAGCGNGQQAPLYEKVAAARRDIVVTASAAGSIEPVLTVDVKSKASGEIIEMRVETGDDVRPGQLLARIDPRQPRNALAQAEANLQVARAQLENARAQLGRADTLFKTQAITEAEYENARLAFANANAAVVRAEADLELARDQMEDTQVRAPLAGTIIQKNVELGTVISSPTRDVGGGTVLFRMANLDTVQVRTLVDETDVGKVQPGMLATITVDAYPNRPFQGSVLKIEPQATVQQNVTMFPVLIRIPNPGHLLKPGMNAEVEIHVGERQGVLAIPYAALRTPRDVGSAAQVLGLDPEAVQRQLAQAAADSAARTGQMGSGSAPAPPAGSGGTFTLPDGRTVSLPAGVSGEQLQAIFRKRFSGGELTAEEQDVLRRFRTANPALGPGGGNRVRTGGPRGPGGTSAGNYIVFTLRGGQPTPVRITTGLTDLDYIEVLSGLTDRDTVLLLPSASLVQAQQEMRERVQRMTGGGLPGVQQQPASGARTPQR
ncbi:MAG TPA: efflux RND transporter periplasmic adaptor subunit [Gemmatimonadales bacterium]|nr:efflux RND transporter periplasmic adaptor subunit [Gemmatimonadales bacterium]